MGYVQLHSYLPIQMRLNLQTEIVQSEINFLSKLVRWQIAHGDQPGLKLLLVYATAKQREKIYQGFCAGEVREPFLRDFITWPKVNAAILRTFFYHCPVAKKASLFDSCDGTLYALLRRRNLDAGLINALLDACPNCIKLYTPSEPYGPAPLHHLMKRHDLKANMIVALIRGCPASKRVENFYFHNSLHSPLRLLLENPIVTIELVNAFLDVSSFSEVKSQLASLQGKIRFSALFLAKDVSFELIEFVLKHCPFEQNPWLYSEDRWRRSPLSLLLARSNLTLEILLLFINRYPRTSSSAQFMADYKGRRPLQFLLHNPSVCEEMVDALIDFCPSSGKAALIVDALNVLGEKQRRPLLLLEQFLLRQTTDPISFPPATRNALLLALYISLADLERAKEFLRESLGTGGGNFLIQFSKCRKSMAFLFEDGRDILGEWIVQKREIGQLTRSIQIAIFQLLPPSQMEVVLKQTSAQERRDILSQKYLMEQTSLDFSQALWWVYEKKLVFVEEVGNVLFREVQHHLSSFNLFNLAVATSQADLQILMLHYVPYMDDVQSAVVVPQLSPENFLILMRKKNDLTHQAFYLRFAAEGQKMLYLAHFDPLGFKWSDWEQKALTFEKKRLDWQERLADHAFLKPTKMLSPEFRGELSQLEKEIGHYTKCLDLLIATRRKLPKLDQALKGNECGIELRKNVEKVIAQWDQRLHVIIAQVKLFQEQSAMLNQINAPPQEFYDLITGTLMTNPVCLSGSAIIDASTLSDLGGINPFNKQEIAQDAVLPQEDLRQRIAQWRKDQTVPKYRFFVRFFALFSNENDELI